MTTIENVDLNLLAALDALLRFASVTGAAQELRITAPAMSRALGRLRSVVGDPLLVRAGRNLVLTPRALALRDRAQSAAREARSVLQDQASTPLEKVVRTFLIRSNESLAGALASRLIRAAENEAPGLRFSFVPEGNEDVEPLRDGKLDLDLGVVDLQAPEIRVQLLRRDRYVGLARRGHALTRGLVTPERLVKHAHLAVTRLAKPSGPLDEKLARLGLKRRLAGTVASHQAALFAIAESELVTIAPSLLAVQACALMPVQSFELPFTFAPVAIAQAWHPRFDVDPPHRWLRAQVRKAALAFPELKTAPARKPRRA